MWVYLSSCIALKEQINSGDFIIYYDCFNIFISQVGKGFYLFIILSTAGTHETIYRILGYPTAAAKKHVSAQEIPSGSALSAVLH